MTEIMNVPNEYELHHLQFQAMMREHDIPTDELMYLGEREGEHWYRIAGEHEVPVSDIVGLDQVIEEEE